MDRRSFTLQTLTPEIILLAYKNGFFPMAHGKNGPIEFFYYDPRGIIPLDDRFTVRRSLRQIISKGEFEIRYDTAFEEVIRNCARHGEIPDREIWISEEMIALYTELHKQGIAHSVEAWKDGVLQGGLYGIVLGSAFCGESMFSHTPYASQVALVTLVEHLRKNNFTLLDAQMESEHLHQFGMYSVNHVEYLNILGEALENLVSF